MKRNRKPNTKHFAKGVSTKVVSVKMWLRNTCNSLPLFEQIQTEVREMSALTIEYSVYLNFIFNKSLHAVDFEFFENKPNFASYIYHLVRRSNGRRLCPNTGPLRQYA